MNRFSAIPAIAVGIGLTALPAYANWFGPSATEQCQKVFNNEQNAKERSNPSSLLGKLMAESMAANGLPIPQVIKVDGSETNTANVYQCIVTEDHVPDALKRSLSELGFFTDGLVISNYTVTEWTIYIFDNGSFTKEMTGGPSFIPKPNHNEIEKHERDLVEIQNHQQEERARRAAAEAEVKAKTMRMCGPDSPQGLPTPCKRIVGGREVFYQNDIGVQECPGDTTPPAQEEKYQKQAEQAKQAREQQIAAQQAGPQQVAETRRVQTAAFHQAIQVASARAVECRNQRLSGELKTHLAAAQCANPAIVEAFQKAGYANMKAVNSYIAYRISLAGSIDRGAMTEEQGAADLVQGAKRLFPEADQ